MHDNHIFDLSYEPPHDDVGPAIVFTIDIQRYPVVAAYYETVPIQLDWAARYCDTPEVDRHPFTHDLFGNIRFGFGQCGTVVQDGNEMHLTIRLGDDLHLKHCVLTINLLLSCLFAARAHDTETTNRQQQVFFKTGCGHDLHGHSVVGHISGELFAWLRAYGTQEANEEEHAPLPRAVRDAMQSTWRAVAPKGPGFDTEFDEEFDHRFEEEQVDSCDGSIRNNGCFSLRCPGNACDISIYPDQAPRRDEYAGSVHFSCHNLDSAAQQVTLLAGLAALCSLARAES